MIIIAKRLNPKLNEKESYGKKPIKNELERFIPSRTQLRGRNWKNLKR